MVRLKSFGCRPYDISFMKCGWGRRQQKGAEVSKRKEGSGGELCGQREELYVGGDDVIIMCCEVCKVCAKKVGYLT